jgi:hypothetical protein
MTFGMAFLAKIFFLFLSTVNLSSRKALTDMSQYKKKREVVYGTDKACVPLIAFIYADRLAGFIN